MENNTGKIGCQAGRTKIVDPNDFGGHGSSFNSPVQLEDLNISVILKTYKKGRTVLYKEGSSSNSENSQEVSINFIEGSTVDGKKVLTTKYTDLTTVFEDGQNNEETLGITNIDIDFNSSYAPMVTINFIDVRGSSIFQNESNVSGNGNGNKYSTFFQIPYPIFELEIKGYYGKPVTYCLHMLKFNSKFNSKTGNFEIQCEFIGYTYAMLSDLLIGYLKAIGNTKTGEEKYKEYNENRGDGSEIVTLSELSKRISKINKGIEKTKNDSASSNSYDNCTRAIENLNDIENQINGLGDLVNITKKDATNDKYEYLVRNQNALTNNEKSLIVSYENRVVELINEFNGRNIEGLILNIDYFKKFDVVAKDKGKYTMIKKSMLSTNTDDTLLSTKMMSPSDLNKEKSDLLFYIDKYYDITEDLDIDVYNLKGLFNEISSTKLKVEKKQEEAKKTLANEMKNSVANDLEFDPTVRNVIEMFTAASEVFMSSIFSVSKAAEDKLNDARITELSKKFNTAKDTDINNNILNGKNLYYAWPEYKEKNDGDTYVQKYLGDAGVLEHPENVNELVFIDELLDGFIKAAQIDEETQEGIDEETKTWFPINPADSKILVNEEPYSRYEFKNYQDVIKLSVIRGMTFLGYSNDAFSLSDEEIKAMGISEAKAILRGIEDSKIRQALIEKSKSEKAIDEFIKIEGNINALDTKVIREKDGYYFYNYIFDTGTSNNPKYHMLIPINKGFDGNWDPTKSKLNDLAEESDYVFLTNYSDAYGYSTSESDKFDKEIDGGVYLKILTRDEYSKNLSFYEQPPSEKNTLILEKLKQDKVDYTAGFNTFGGQLGIQEFSTVDCGNGEDGPNGLKVKYLFYRQTAPHGLALKRTDKDKTQPFDFKGTFKTTFKSEYFDNGFNNWVQTGENLHDGTAKNLDLFKQLSNNASSELTFPYIEIRAFETADSGYRKDIEHNTDRTFSLFGSKFYYAQKTQHAKAFLFLNALPFKKGYGVDENGPFADLEIKHLFDTRSGFIQAPKLWCAWVGSILWRLDESNPIKTDGKQTDGGSGSLDPIFTTKDGVSEFGSVLGVGGESVDRDEFFDIVDWAGWLLGVPPNYFDIHHDLLLKRLPTQVIKEFKRIFFEFVNGDGNGISWDTIRDYLEIWTGNSTGFNKFLDDNRDLSYDNGTNSKATYEANPSFKNGKENKSYVVISPIKTSSFSRDGAPTDSPTGLGSYWWDDAFHLELAGSYSDNNAVQTLINALDEEVYLMNTGYRIWGSGFDADINRKTSKYDIIDVPKNSFEIYFSSLITALKDNGDDFTEKAVTDRALNSVFGTTNLPTIKLLLYKHCKNIHDKWLAGVKEEDKIMYQCGNKRSSLDYELAKKYNNKNPKFIDTFRFVSRSFEDIGDILYIDPTPINDYLISNQNTSMYDTTSSLLNANKFEFIALPTYVNFRNDEELKSIFTPYSDYGKAIASGSCGPSFVSVYTGEKSKHLAVANADYPNDSFDLRCDGKDINVNIPDDFKANNSAYEDPVGVFVVKYSQQNQNIFKDIVLDQSEFTETEESLQIVEDISQKGSDTNRSFAGQNLYNTYSLRSYTANVEMMGNAMIQPMMYFQLDNIPMFHGAYMITQVKHSIKPNNMSTNFKGVRIKYSKTKLIDAIDIYMSLIDSLPSGNGGGGGGDRNVNKNFTTAYKSDLKANIPSDKLIVGVLTSEQKTALYNRAKKEISNWKDGKLDEKDGTQYLDVYAKATPGPSGDSYASNASPWSGVFISYIMLAADNDFPKSPSHYNYITSAMKGQNGYEVFALNTGLKIKVEIGDIINKPRPGDYTWSHSEVVYAVKGDIAYLVGGNVGDSIKKVELKIKNGYIDDSVNVGEYTLYMKKTNNKYYKSKKLIGTGVPDDIAPQSGCPRVSSNKPMKKQLSYKDKINKQLKSSSESVSGFKEIPEFYSNGKITKKGIIALTAGILEGLDTSPERKNPGNIRANGKGFKTFSSWKDGWQAYADKYLVDWVDGDVPATASAKYPSCYTEDSNKIFKESGLSFNNQGPYNYTNGNPITLRQYTNIYAPWGDSNNPTNYCAAISATLLDYGYKHNIDDKIKTWLS